MLNLILNTQLSSYSKSVDLDDKEGTVRTMIGVCIKSLSDSGIFIVCLAAHRRNRPFEPDQVRDGFAGVLRDSVMRGHAV